MNQLITQDTIAMELDNRGIRYSPLSLEIPESTSFEDWSDLGHKLCRAEHVMTWWIADWAAFGDKQWGAVKKFAEANGWACKTLYNAARVARQVDSSRRREDLSFGHHEAVSAEPARKQIEWLEKASSESIPCGKLRAAIRVKIGKKNANKPDGVIINWPQDRSVEGLILWFKSHPVEEMKPEAREWWKVFLKPLVEIYNTL